MDTIIVTVIVICCILYLYNLFKPNIDIIVRDNDKYSILLWYNSTRTKRNYIKIL